MARSPDVLILGLNYPPEPTGNAPYTGSLAVGLAQLGYDVTANVAHPHYPEWTIRPGYGGWSRTEQHDGVQVHRLRHYIPAKPRGIWRLLSELSFGLRLMFCRVGHPRLVIAVSPSLFSTALAVLRVRLAPRRRRVAVWVQDIYTLGLAEIGEGGGLVQRITRWVESRTLRTADRVVVVHDRFKDFVTRELGVPADRVVVIRNWTHLPTWEPVESAEAKEKLGWPSGKTLAVHTGNMGAKQGLENIVEAARIAGRRGAKVQFLLIGDGGERRALEESAQGVANVTFIDPLDDDDYGLALAAADVLLVNEKPGVANMAVPSKLTSYFAAGRPVVAATDPGGITAAEVRAAQAGVVVPAGDPESLLHAILDLGSDPEAADRFGSSGQRYRESVLDQRSAIRKWSDLIEEGREPQLPPMDPPRPRSLD
ncbi:glycosyltransferase [Mycolicibacterium sp.]|uniref:glycosyltransferase n=1 Tax=Mycolicibacterium sp. TaxID=2320850 RepID=UPI0025E6B2C7|nr:glycosyltransferase [Mycolicibacterium sp.]MCB9409827.1 glycosyltransferase [Mycolicibacterium sp.]